MANFSSFLEFLIRDDTDSFPCRIFEDINLDKLLPCMENNLFYSQINELKLPWHNKNKLYLKNKFSHLYGAL